MKDILINDVLINSVFERMKKSRFKGRPSIGSRDQVRPNLKPFSIDERQWLISRVNLLERSLQFVGEEDRLLTKGSYIKERPMDNIFDEIDAKISGYETKIAELNTARKVLEGLGTKEGDKRSSGARKTITSSGPRGKTDDEGVIKELSNYPDGTNTTNLYNSCYGEGITIPAKPSFTSVLVRLVKTGKIEKLSRGMWKVIKDGK